MNNSHLQEFDAEQALECSAFTARVQSSDDQHRLDIVEKLRSSALPWRGQFSPQLIEYLLGRYCESGDTVLDPFCASGTLLHEAARAGINAIGLDVNPAAICLAKVSEISRVSISKRWKILEALSDFAAELRELAYRGKDEVSILDAVMSLNNKQHDYINHVAIEGLLLFLFSHGKVVTGRKIKRGTKRYYSTIMNIPKFNGKIEANVGDARSVGVEDGTFDYLVTSPPYINVFNYHQNYRPIIQGLGYTPLSAARSEIGANRKFRQNRYLTVVQYCMDMAQFFVEVNRVLKKGAKITIILGRESNVRSVAFKNGELISAVACEGMGFGLIEWHERKFMNRFGESIFEDVLTIAPAPNKTNRAVEVGRSVGKQALQNALAYCPVERIDEISRAIESADAIEISPLVKECSR